MSSSNDRVAGSETISQQPLQTTDPVDESTPSTPISSVVPSSSSFGSSPRLTRKRTNDDVYSKDDVGPSSPSRTIRLALRQSTAPEQTHRRRPTVPDSPESKTSLRSSRRNTMQSLDFNIPRNDSDENIISGHNITTPTNRTFVEDIQIYQDELENDFKRFEDGLKQSPSGVSLEPVDWNNFEDEYNRMMDPLVANEEKLLNDFTMRFQHFLLWMQASNSRETERAIKRLRTRISYVKNSQEKLAEGQAHYEKVLNAFQSAMALLGNF